MAQRAREKEIENKKEMAKQLKHLTALLSQSTGVTATTKVAEDKIVIEESRSNRSSFRASSVKSAHSTEENLKQPKVEVIVSKLDLGKT